MCNGPHADLKALSQQDWDKLLSKYNANYHSSYNLDRRMWFVHLAIQFSFCSNESKIRRNVCARNYWSKTITHLLSVLSAPSAHDCVHYTVTGCTS